MLTKTVTATTQRLATRQVSAPLQAINNRATTQRIGPCARVIKAHGLLSQGSSNHDREVRSHADPQDQGAKTMFKSSTSFRHTAQQPSSPLAQASVVQSNRGAHQWRRQALRMLTAYLVIHNGAATLVNDWEGWSNFASNFLVITIWGLALVGLTFGLLVRWGLKDSPTGRNRAALASLGAGVGSVLAYAVYFMWAPFVVGPAAVILALSGLRAARESDGGGRGYALAGGILGGLSSAYWTFCIVFVLSTGSFPLPGPK